jgi:c-di-GMP-binding flagellar brake protein YcgR
MTDSDVQREPQSANRDRRNHRRVERRVEVNIKGEAESFEIRGKTWNLSPVGAYCRVDRAIPEMTQLMMVLDLPQDHVVCKGTVVRRKSDLENPGYHELAIFFHDISEPDKAKLFDFVEN